MKTIFLSLIFCCGTALCFSQEAKQDPHAQQTPQYCCVKKDYCGAKGKKCPNDQMPLIKDGLYYCPQCYHKSNKPGICGKCDIPLVKMEKKG